MAIAVTPATPVASRASARDLVSFSPRRFSATTHREAARSGRGAEPNDVVAPLCRSPNQRLPRAGSWSVAGTVRECRPRGKRSGFRRPPIPSTLDLHQRRRPSDHRSDHREPACRCVGQSGQACALLGRMWARLCWARDSDARRPCPSRDRQTQYAVAQKQVADQGIDGHGRSIPTATMSLGRNVGWKPDASRLHDVGRGETAEASPRRSRPGSR